MRWACKRRALVRGSTAALTSVTGAAPASVSAGSWKSSASISCRRSGFGLGVERGSSWPRRTDRRLARLRRRCAARGLARSGGSSTQAEAGLHHVGQRGPDCDLLGGLDGTLGTAAAEELHRHGRRAHQRWPHHAAAMQRKRGRESEQRHHTRQSAAQLKNSGSKSGLFRQRGSNVVTCAS